MDRQKAISFVTTEFEVPCHLALRRIEADFKPAREDSFRHDIRSDHTLGVVSPTLAPNHFR